MCGPFVRLIARSLGMTQMGDGKAAAQGASAARGRGADRREHRADPCAGESLTKAQCSSPRDHPPRSRDDRMPRR
jgi:hypothetical protein